VLQKSNTSKPLLIYIAAIKDIIYTTILQEQDNEEHLVYFVSRTLQDVDSFYQMVEKVVLSPLTIVTRSRPFFQSYMVVVRTNYPIQKILPKPNLTGKMVFWTMEL